MWALQRGNRVDFDCIPDPDYSDFKRASDLYKTEHGADMGVTVGCGVFFSNFYFLSYRIVAEMIFLNLFIAIILQGFDDTNQRENSVLNNDVAE
jgi:hypothetical protein